MNHSKKKIHLSTAANFYNTGFLPQNKNISKNYSNFNLSNNSENTLPFLQKSNILKNADKLNKKVKIKKSKLFKSQEKLSKLIKEEENFKKIYLNIIKNKVKDEDKDFDEFLLNSNDITLDDPLYRIIQKSSFSGREQNNINLRHQNRTEREINKVYRLERNLGKNENDCNDYIRRFKNLFPNEAIEDLDLKLKKEKVTIIQRFFREHKNKIKIKKVFKEPHYYIRIYANEEDIYPLIKNIEIKIYSTLFKKNIDLIKSTEELFGVNSMTIEKIQKNIDIIIDKIIGNQKVKSNQKDINKDYYDESKADLSSDDFDDFETD